MVTGVLIVVAAAPDPDAIAHQQTPSPIALAGDARALSATAVPDDLRRVLNDVMLIYRKHWWPAHDAANRKRISEFQSLLAKHGRAMVDRLTRLYQEPWPPGGVRVQVAAYTNWAGAYSTRGPLLVVSSLAAAHNGSSGMEILFHEAMHQWDDQMMARLDGAAAAAGIRAPNELSHAMIFYTAGHVTRAVVGDAHVPYADANGIWQRGLGRYRAALDAHWRPYLDGAGSLDDALRKLIAAGAGS